MLLLVMMKKRDALLNCIGWRGYIIIHLIWNTVKLCSNLLRVLFQWWLYHTHLPSLFCYLQVYYVHILIWIFRILSLFENVWYFSAYVRRTQTYCIFSINDIVLQLDPYPTHIYWMNEWHSDCNIALSPFSIWTGKNKASHFESNWYTSISTFRRA